MRIKYSIPYLLYDFLLWCFYYAGHAAMECACCNLIERGESVLVGCNGIWGERFSDMVDRQEGLVHKLLKPYGETFSLEEIEEVSRIHLNSLLIITSISYLLVHNLFHSEKKLIFGA